MKALPPSSNNYPVNLLTLDNPPALFVNGEIKPGDANAIAIVGSRQMTQNGKSLAYQFSSALAKAGFIIISGLARGIDTIAHETALNARGRTIAVLGSGLDIIYPKENARLAQKISQNGAVVTQFRPGTKPLAKNFLARNRIVSGLAKALLVIEGSKRSGTLSTVSWAANQGRDVFAIPGSEATDYLIDEGAIIVHKPEDILEYLYGLNNS